MSLLPSQFDTIAGSLRGKVALVTGAGSGIGKATAKLFAHAGARIAVLERTEKDLKKTVDEITSSGGEARAYLADISEAALLETTVSSIGSEFGKIDIVIANAGINGIQAPLEKITVEEWDQTLDINLRGTFLTLKYAAPFLKKHGGAVVVISSVNGNRLFSNTGSTAYSCSKAAEVALVKMLAIEFAPHRVRINAICPGSIKTHIHDSTVKRDLESVEVPIEYPKGSIPLKDGQPGSAEEVAELAWFLVSRYSSHITGTEVYIDGGQSLVEG